MRVFCFSLLHGLWGMTFGTDCKSGEPLINHPEGVTADMTEKKFENPKHQITEPQHER